MSKILVNQAKCLKCGDTPYSAYTHDFKSCKCESIAVDGGMNYLRRSGELDSYEDISIVIEDELYEACVKQLEWCDETSRNNLGRICALFRAIRDSGFELRKKDVDLIEKV